MRLIDADALKAEKFYSHERHENCVSVYAIDTMPTIEPNRPHGEWTCNGNDLLYICSVCGEVLPYSDEYDYQTDFCPNCGADMREKEGETA